MKKSKVGIHTNWPVMILLILGLSTIAFPLYMAVVIAFKQPSEMTNSISGILSLPSHWSLSNFAQAMEVTDFWRSLGNSILITEDLSANAMENIGYADGYQDAFLLGEIQTCKSVVLRLEVESS